MNVDRNKAIGFGLLILLAGSGSYAYSRLKQRALLVEMIKDSKLYQQAAADGRVSWTPEEKAVELIPLMGTTTADEAMVAVRKSLPPPDEAMSENTRWLVNTIEEGRNILGNQILGLSDDQIEAAESAIRKNVESALSKSKN